MTYVLPEGVAHHTPANISTSVAIYEQGFDIPTNPVIIDNNGTFGTTNYNRLFTIIKEDDISTDETIIEQASSPNTQYNNLATTKGYRIQCYDDTTQSGYRINSFDLDNYDYFVLIHSDDYLQHHVAKITQSLTGDVSGDSFEFEPRLGNEIPKDTKFMLFKGLAKTSTVVAISVGILTQETYKVSSSYYNRMFCSRPHTYFYNDKLDKKNELNHNTKYQFLLGGQHIDGHASISTTISSWDRNTSVTVADFGTKIIDYSKYELKIDLVDNLRTLDANAHSHVTNENKSGAFVAVFAQSGLGYYHQAYYHPRREFNDRVVLDGVAWNGFSPSAIDTLAGPTRYLHYDFSPNKCNVLSNVMDSQIYDSLGGKGGIAESKIIDSSKILNKKITEFDSYKARHRVYKGKLDEWVDTGVTFKERHSASGGWDFNTDFDLGKQGVTDTNKLFGTLEELKIDNKIYIVYFVTGTLSNGVQRVTMSGYHRELTDTYFTLHGSSTPSADAKVYRRAWSPNAQNILTNFNLIPNRSNLIIKIVDNGFHFTEGTVTEVDANFGLMLVDFDKEHYPKLKDVHGNSLLNYTNNASYFIEIERFDGEIETVNSYHDSGQTIMEISGRDKLNKLLSPIVNKNTLYSADIIYSSKSPYNKVTSLGTCEDVTFDDKTVTATGSVTVVTGDKIFIESDTASQNLIYLGTVAGDSSNDNFELVDYPNCENKGLLGGSAGQKALYKVSNKNYVFNKALSSNHLDTSVTSLMGAANRGLYFDGGVKLETNGSEGDSLAGTSIFTDKPEAIGYYISEPLGIGNDNAFQCRLDNDASTKTYYGEDVINTLLDFTILKIKPSDNQNTIVEIAPYVPLTLGRVDINYANTEDTTFPTTSFTVGGGAYNNNTTITHTSSTLIIQGMSVSGDGIPTNAYVESITSNTQFVLSATTTGGSKTGQTLTFSYPDLGTCASATNSRYLTIDISNSSSAAYWAIPLSTVNNPKQFHKKPVYIDGVFIGKFVSATYHNNYTLGNQEIRIFIDRDVTTSGGKVQVLGYSDSNESTKLTHELNLLNGGHLHTGKIISLISPLITANSEGQVAHYDFPHVYHSDHYADSYSAKMGTSQYRIYNLEKGNFSLTSYPVTKRSNSHELQAKEYYSEKPSVIPYYASAYKFGSSYRINSGAYLSGKVGTDLTTDLDNTHLLIEQRGNQSPLGSRFWDIDILSPASYVTMITGTEMFYPSVPSSSDFNLGTNEVNGINPFYSKSMFELIDPKISRMFIFSNSDLLPYSSTRKDSLMYGSQTRDLTKYSVLALKEPVKGNRADTKGGSVGTSTTLSLTDSDYTSSNIISAEKTISDLKRFSMMRLTEVVLDWAFNQIDPENIISNERTIPKVVYSSFNMTSSGITSQITDNSAANYLDGAIKNLTASSPWVVDDIVCDSRGRYIGRIESITGSGPYTVNFHETGFKTDGLNYYAGLLYRIPESEYVEEGNLITGHGDSDGFIHLSKQIHMLKSAVMQQTAYYNSGVQAGYGDSSSDFYSKHGNYYLGGDTGTTNYTLSVVRNPNLWLPINVSDRGAGTKKMSLVHKYESSITHSKHPFTVLYHLSETEQLDDTSLDAKGEFYNNFIPVFFDRFDIEDGGNSRADIGMAGGYVTATSTKTVNALGSSQKGLFGLKLENKFGNKKHDTDSSSRTYDKTADGVIYGFKPTITLKNSSFASSGGVTNATTDKTTGNKTVYRYEINASGEYRWLDFFDLTGCYLVSNETERLDEDGDISEQDWRSINNSKPKRISYVISHEIDTGASLKSDGSYDHILVLDNIGDHDKPMRIMQPNHTCFYSFGPKTIIPNMMSCEYTKKPKDNSMYSSEINNYELHNATASSTTVGTIHNNDAVQSMYIIIDPDNQTVSDYLVLRKDKIHTLLSGIDTTMCISDGDEAFKSSVSYVGDSDSFKKGLKFDKMKTILGIASISETMNITINKPLPSDSKRLMIGSVTNICDEAEGIVNDLLEENDIEFSLTKSDYPLFLSPNFQGIDLYSALNFVLTRKNKQLTVEEGIYTIRDEESPLYYSKVIISEDSDYQIYDYKKIKSTFDFYNEIIVYSGKYRGIKKDIKSITKRGKKTLEVVENELFSQKEVDKRATELLLLHSKFNTPRFQVTIGHQNISQLKVGDVVGFELKRENIPLSHYIVLEIKHEMVGNMTLTLGKYSKGLGDRFAELLVETKKLKTSIRRQEFSDSLLSYNILDNVKIRPLRLLIRTKSSTGSFKLGFDTSLNTGTTKLGFEGGASITFNTLIDEDLR